jgi:hypothetical protein
MEPPKQISITYIKEKGVLIFNGKPLQEKVFRIIDENTIEILIDALKNYHFYETSEEFEKYLNSKINDKEILKFYIKVFNTINEFNTQKKRFEMTLLKEKSIDSPKEVAAMSKSSSSGIWTKEDFLRNRPELSKFIDDNIKYLLEKNRISGIKAPVKSGKRQMVEYIKVSDKNPKRKHIFISAFHRIADESQRKELENYGLKVYSICNKKHSDKCLKEITKLIDNDKNEVIIHLDECDYGSGYKQNLAKIWEKFKGNTMVKLILYSATIEEAAFSAELKELEYSDSKVYRYYPPETFCGPKTFLSKGLVSEVEKFFYLDKEKQKFVLSKQGLEIIMGLKESIKDNPNRNIVIIRLSYFDKNTNYDKKKAIYNIIENIYNIDGFDIEQFRIIIDKGDSKFNEMDGINLLDIKWTDKTSWDPKKGIHPKETLTLIFIDQTSSRSTEWECHHRIYAYHDYRKNVCFATVSQAVERVNHYSTKYSDGFQPIKVYCPMNVIQLSAEDISYSDYLNACWYKKLVEDKEVKGTGKGKAKGKGKGKAEAKAKKYIILNSNSQNETRHQIYNNEYEKEEAKKILAEINKKYIISDRTETKLIKRPIVECEFYPCNKGDYEKLKEDIKERYNLKSEKQNPFVNSEKEKEKNPKKYPTDKYPGYLREWKVFTYEEIKNHPGWGMTDCNERLTICYKDDELGIAVRKSTGEQELQTSLATSSKSMYAQSH